MENKNRLKKLILVEYPGVVKNVENALKTLGGPDYIAKVFESTKNRLELRFRPDDPYCKPTFSKKQNTFAYLLKVNIMKQEGGTKTIQSSEVIGFIDTVYKFERYVDFQFLPVAKDINLPTGEEKIKCLLNDLLPVGMVGVDWFNQAKHSFLVPPLFTRIDVPYKYGFRSSSNLDNPLDAEQKIVSRIRKTRVIDFYRIAFSHLDAIPTGPKKSLPECKYKDEYDIVLKLFEERPIWSRAELLYKLNLSPDYLKVVLPSIAYRFTNGPWRTTWVKFGYDPRKDPSSRIYQIIDFRVKNLGGLKKLINTKNAHKILFLSAFRSGESLNNQDKKDEKYFVFKSGVLPPGRQMYYQYCNLKVPEIQDMLASLPEVLPGSLCHEKRGWMPSNFDDECRQILNNYVIDKSREITAENSSQLSNMFVMDNDDLDSGDEGVIEEEQISDYDSDLDVDNTDMAMDEEPIAGPSNLNY